MISKFVVGPGSESGVRGSDSRSVPRRSRGAFRGAAGDGLPTNAHPGKVVGMKQISLLGVRGCGFETKVSCITRALSICIRATTRARGYSRLLTFTENAESAPPGVESGETIS